jgi:hypothetical protein
MNKLIVSALFAATALFTSIKVVHTATPVASAQASSTINASFEVGMSSTAYAVTCQQCIGTWKKDAKGNWYCDGTEVSCK